MFGTAPSNQTVGKKGNEIDRDNQTGEIQHIAVMFDSRNINNLTGE